MKPSEPEIDAEKCDTSVDASLKRSVANFCILLITEGLNKFISKKNRNRQIEKN